MQCSALQIWRSRRAAIQKRHQRKNKGTEIIVRPCQRIAEAPEEPEEQKTISCSPELFAGKRVFLVEDNSMNREIATAILEEAGFKVDTAENGAIAVEKVTYRSLQ